jgi:diaminohydroxyphosphoribosylaminopyrimidine deaminase / 5-amino-6-(5-phosphoribosylamino)uracil reductase
VFRPFDQAMMRRALALAERGLYTTTPNPRVGCVITRDETVVAEAWHQRAGEPLPKRAAAPKARPSTLTSSRAATTAAPRRVPER